MSDACTSAFVVCPGEHFLEEVSSHFEEVDGAAQWMSRKEERFGSAGFRWKVCGNRTDQMVIKPEIRA
jgi:hypothetical protein